MCQTKYLCQTDKRPSLLRIRNSEQATRAEHSEILIAKCYTSHEYNVVRLLMVCILETKSGGMTNARPHFFQMVFLSIFQNRTRKHFRYVLVQYSSVKKIFSVAFNPFVPIAPFLYPLITTENLTVSNIFRG